MDEDEPVAEPTDRNYWETKRATKKSVLIADSLVRLVNEIEPKATLKYNKHYIGLEVNGSAMNFVSFIPRKSNVIMSLKIPHAKEVDDLLSENEFDTLSYEHKWRQYRIRIDAPLENKQREILLQLISMAYNGYGKTA